MEINFKNMGEWETEKALFLCNEARKLDMDISGYGFCDVNPNSGNTYLWLEDYNFCLFMPINCDLVKTDIQACYSCPIDGEEDFIDLEDGTTLQDLEKWASKLSDKSQQKEEVT